MSEDVSASVLVVVIVYNGDEVVPQCLKSAIGQRSDHVRVDVLVLDDCSPAPGWSDELAQLCTDLGVRYHRNSRNLGIPRNMALAMLAGLEGGYSHMVLCNSDTVLGAGSIGHMAEVAMSSPDIASVTAWSNNVSIFSLEGNAEDLRDPSRVDQIDRDLWATFETRAIDLPTGVGFCMLLPTAVIARIGVTDPVFGRGYCEEVDWCLRANAVGLRNVLAPGTFVFHDHGSVSSRAAGLLEEGVSTVWANEAIIDHRYPEYRRLVEEFMHVDELAALRATARSAIVLGEMTNGYAAVVGDDGSHEARVLIDPATGSCSLRAFGLTVKDDFPLGLASVIERVGRPPSGVLILSPGRVAEIVAEGAASYQIPVTRRAPYPQSV